MHPPPITPAVSATAKANPLPRSCQPLGADTAVTAPAVQMGGGGERKPVAHYCAGGLWPVINDTGRWMIIELPAQPAEVNDSLIAKMPRGPSLPAL